jgi:hypothetical protein
LFFCGWLSSEPYIVRFPGWFSAPIGWRALLLVLLPATLAAAWSGRRWLATVTAVAAGAALTYRVYTVNLPAGYLSSATRRAVWLTVPLLLLAALVLLVGSTERPRRSWLWLPWVPLGVAALAAIAARLRLGPVEHVLAWLGTWGQIFPLPHLTVLMLVASVCWLVADARPLLGLALGCALEQSNGIFVSMALDLPRMGHSLWQLYWPSLVVLAALLAIPGVLVWLLCRRPRIAPPAGS